MTRVICILEILFMLTLSANATADVITFDDLTNFTGVSGNADGQPGGQFYNGDSGNGTNTNGWSSGGAFFNNSFNASFGGFWSGWSYSTVQNSVTTGFGNQYASAAGGGSDGQGSVAAGGTYAIAFGSGGEYINLAAGSNVESVDLTNTTYAASSMRDGDAFAKEFGGPSGNDADYFRVTLTGYDQADRLGNVVGSVTVDLADFSFVDNSNDYILRNWTNVDLTSIGLSRSVDLTFESSDVGLFGINTPTYVALDNLSISSASAVPEPSAFLMSSVFGVFTLIFRRRRKRNAIMTVAHRTAEAH